MTEIDTKGPGNVMWLAIIKKKAICLHQTADLQQNDAFRMPLGSHDFQRSSSCRTMKLCPVNAACKATNIE